MPGHGPLAEWKLARETGGVNNFCEGFVARKWELNRLKRQPRIVSLAPSATSILCEIGARSLLVGVTKWCADVADVRGLPRVGDCWHMGDVAQIMKLRPSLVIGSVPYKHETAAKLLAEPVNFLAMNPRSLVDVEADVRLLAGIVGRAAAGERLVRKMRRRFAAIARESAAALKSAGAVRVYCEAWPNPRISSPPWVAELVRMAGGEMTVPAGERVSEDRVAAGQPEVIVLAWAATGTRADVKKAYEVAQWQHVSAIREGRVFVIADELLNTPGPPLVGGLEELSKAISSARSKQPRSRRHRGAQK